MSNTLTAKFTGTTPAAPGTAILGIVAPDPTFTGGSSNQVYGALSRYESLIIDFTRQGATGGNLDIYLQVSLDEGASWTDIGHWAQLTAGAAQVRDVITISRFQSNTTPVVSGDAAIAAGTFVNGEFTNRIRFKAVAGASTSAGAAYTIKLLLNTTSSG